MGMVKKYKLFVTPKDGTDYNPVHDDVDYKETIILEAKKGERCWMCVRVDDPYTPWHRIATSPIVDILVKDDGEYVSIETENTYYDFEPWRD